MFANKLHERAHETLKAGKIQEAIALYTQALEQHPNHYDIISDRGVAYLHAEDETNCMKDLSRAVELQPNYAYRYASRAYARNHFGDIDGAVVDYEKAVALDPEDAVAHNNLGMLLEQKGYQNEAKERFERADNLSKMEDNLLNVIDELENDEKPTTPTAEAPTNEVESKPDSEEKSRGKEMKKIFTSRKQFAEFIEFMKNGFKLK